MWQGHRERNSQEPRRRASVAAMAHRRQLAGRRIVASTAGLLMLFLLMAGSVYVSNRVTALRSGIAGLENRRDVLEAGSAKLLTAWNTATAPAVITERARMELGLVAPMEPGLVLVQLPADGQRTSPWRRWWSNVGGRDAVAAADAAPLPVMGTMVSLTPRQARGQGSGR